MIGERSRLDKRRREPRGGDRPHTVCRLPALETLRILDAARADVLCHEGIWAERSGSIRPRGHFTCRCLDAIRCVSFFHPLDNRRERVISVGGGTSGAVSPPRDGEQSYE